MNRILFCMVTALLLALTPKISIAQNSCCAKSDSSLCKSEYSPEDILLSGDKLLDKEVVLVGRVSHVCRSSGKKLFLSGKDDEKSIQVLVGGNIEKFDMELTAENLRVKGVVNEHRIAKSIIDKQQADAEAEMKEEDCTNMSKCENVMSRVKQMRQWMTENAKDYYPVYYIKAIEYTVLQEQ